jgi:hypothetical protein
MYRRLAFSHLRGAIAFVLLAVYPAAASAQEHQGHDMQMDREGSGTAWLPDGTPMYAIHWQRGAWHDTVIYGLLRSEWRQSSGAGSRGLKP